MVDALLHGIRIGLARLVGAPLQPKHRPAKTMCSSHNSLQDLLIPTTQQRWRGRLTRPLQRLFWWKRYPRPVCAQRRVFELSLLYSGEHGGANLGRRPCRPRFNGDLASGGWDK